LGQTLLERWVFSVYRFGSYFFYRHAGIREYIGDIEKIEILVVVKFHGVAFVRISVWADPSLSSIKTNFELCIRKSDFSAVQIDKGIFLYPYTFMDHRLAFSFCIVPFLPIPMSF
jgi:hypothetical protein